MSDKTTISWTTHTWSPWWGCTAVSPACDHCYAETFSRRLGYSEKSTKFPIWGKDSPRKFFGDEHWTKPIKWDKAAAKRGDRIRSFPSMCDVMEDRRDLDEWRAKTFDLIESTPHTDWLLLTKRPQNFRRFFPKAWIERPQPNVWAMATVESPAYFWRIDALRDTPAVIRGLSMEPLLENPVGLEKHLDGIHWIITGGESGPKYRPAEPDWFRYVRDACKEPGLALHHKQNGGLRPNSSGCLLDGAEHKEFPK